MTIRNVVKFVVVIALVFAVAGGYGVFTAKAGVGSSARVLEDHPPRVASPKEILQFEKLLTGSADGLSIPVDSPTLIDGESINCPGPKTCNIAVDEWLQVVGTATTNWAVFTFVDGDVMTGGGPYEGVIGTDFAVGSYSESSVNHVNPGTHKLQTYGYMRDNPGEAYGYNFNYKVFKP